MQASQIYTVVKSTSLYWEDVHSCIVFTSFDMQEAIAFAKTFYIKNEMDLISHYDFSRVEVNELPVGEVENERCVWCSSKDLKFMTKAQLESEIAIKPTFSILWDAEVPVEQEDLVNPKYFSDHQQFVANSEAVQLHILNKKSVVANDMAWDLYERYEMQA
ncbi:hypothetical protein [Vibrio owensii]|uniref:hypothetical protein n=1 Tax=Vibrio harveyi group TaxID=717610 RepID=UPI003CC69793